MSNVLYDRLLRDLEERNLATERVMKDAATRHAAVDSVVDGAAGFSPALSPQIAVLSAQLLAQTKYLYPPMIEGLADIYDADPDDDTNSVAARVVHNKALAQEARGNFLVFAAENGLLGEIGTQMRAAISSQFGEEFLINVIEEALSESVGGLAHAQVPWVGARAAACTAAILTWKITWRVGTTVSIYFQNNSDFVGSRAATTKLVKKQFVTGAKRSPQDGSLERFRSDIPVVRTKMGSDGPWRRSGPPASPSPGVQQRTGESPADGRGSRPAA